MLNTVCVLHPALIFDVIEQSEKTFPSPGPSHPDGNNTPEWCKCGRCRPMATIREQLCCGCLPENCHSTLPVSTVTNLATLPVRHHADYISFGSSMLHQCQ